jgi:Tfp pilus assembly protein PilO
MLKSFKNSSWRDPQLMVRVILGVLLLANVVAAALVLFPLGGSAEDLDRQRVTLQTQLTAKQALLEQTRKHAAAVDKGRSAGDDFLSQYFLPNRTYFSKLLTELQQAAGQTKLKAKDTSYSPQPIEGSDTLSVMSITAAYEGTYADLMHFVHELDKSDKFLIIESLSATPQQSGDILAVSLKVNAFVREDATQQGGQ